MSPSATAVAADGPLPDHLRCNRSDGRGWRCKRRVMDSKKVCDIHYVQGRLRQNKEKVPDSLKFKHGENRRDTETKLNTSDLTIALPAQAIDGSRVSGGVRVSERKKKKLEGKKEKLDVKREKLEVKKGKKRKRAGKEEGVVSVSAAAAAATVVNRELTRDLPFGVMEIAPEVVPEKANVGSGEENGGSSGVKLGVQVVNYVRKFRSKNAEQAPVGTVKVVPGVAASVRKRKRRKCHWCKRSNNRSLVKCLKCKKQFFCDDCIKERHQDAAKVKSACSVCSGTCSCDTCQTGSSKDADAKEIMKKPSSKDAELMCFRYLIRLLLPVIEKINQECEAELQMVAKFEGKNVSEVDIRQADGGFQMQLVCNSCNSAIMNLHRSCLRCSVALCLQCCGYFSQGGHFTSSDTSVAEERFRLRPCSTKKKLEKKQKCIENAGSVDIASITCPHREIEGCGESLLELRCLFPSKWTKELESGANDMFSSHDDEKTFSDSSNCTLCVDISHEATKDKELIEAARRTSSSDNFLYCTSARGDHDNQLTHFQKHWQKGQPILVRDVILDGESNVSWDPAAMFYTYLESNSVESQKELEAGKSPQCLDRYEVEFGVKESFAWSSENSHTHLQRETLKLKAELLSAFSQRVFVDHYAEIFNSLPFQEYTNPSHGLLNIAANSMRDSQAPKLGQQLSILCGSHEEVVRGNLVTSLRYHSHDLINILVHASDATCSSEELNKIRRLLRKKSRDKQEQFGQNAPNGVRLEHSEITDDAGEGRVLEETHLSSTNNLQGSNASPAKAHTSDTDSDVSIMCSGTNESPAKSTSQPVNLDKSSKSSDKNAHSEPSIGASWDIFRREDVPLILDYIRRHSDEFSREGSLHNEASHPILDRRILLDLEHKMRLKEELNIEPWTFNQRAGEAVVIPAGCLYQIKSLKSSVHATTGFISPESAMDCIKLTEQFCDLPKDQKAREGNLEVRKLALHSVSKAIEEVRKIS